MQVRASLPDVVEIVGHLRGVDIVDLSDCTLRSKLILMAKADFERYKHEELSTAFDVYFVENEKVCAKAMSRDTHKLDDFLLLLTQFNEIKDPSTPTRGDVFAKLLHLMLARNYNVRPTLASLNYILERTPNVIELESNAIGHIRNLLFKQHVERTTKYPKLVCYILQNFNKMPLREFKSTQLPEIPLSGDQFKVNTFLLESLVALTQNFKFELDINLNALNNAPTIRQGVLEAMSLVEKVQKSQLRHSKQIRFQADRIDSSKTALWEIVLFLWLVQCLFALSRNPAQAAQQRVRIVALKRCLFKAHVRQPDFAQESERFTDSRSLSEISHLRDIYLDQDQTFQPLQLISRALVDQQFSQFIMKVPTLLEHYSNKNRPQLVELEGQVEKRVKQAYWHQYSLFRETFGLKLNYSVKREKGINEVRLVKRLERKWFKPPEEESKADEDETFLENTKDQDNSFVSISEDQLNRSILSNTSAFTLGLQDKFNQSTGFVLGKSLKKDDQSSLAAYTQADLVREPTPLQNIQDLSDIELHQEFTRDLEEKRVVEQFAKTEQIEGYQGIKMLDESSLAAEETLKKSKVESQEPALQEDVFITQAKELAAAQTGFA